ncbi:MAG: hypothetical protein JW776_16075 [Candidatus Lokiarchaeota archaeon]|nr:hypothetical protein [Candidatus Lokiarchaeota archaeon]
MAKIPKFCPECGTEMGGKPVCEKCGFDTKITEENKSVKTSSSDSSSTWESLEPFVTVLGKYAWIFVLVSGVVHIILGIVYITTLRIGSGIWALINAGVLIALSIIWVKPKFSELCGNKEWEKLLTDVVVIDKIQIPWMLIMGVLLEIFGYGWGGLFVLVCALFIIFLGPRKYEWKIQ